MAATPAVRTETGFPAPEVVRPRTVVIGTVFATAAAVMAFTALVAIYVLRRAETLASGAEWFPEDSLELGPPGMVLSTLVLSVVTVHWAVSAIGDDDRVNAFWALGLTTLFGAAVFNQLWFIISDTGFSVDGGEAQFLFFVLNGAFVVFLIGAVVFVAVTFFRALAGGYGHDRTGDVVSAAIFWDTVVVMWAITWYVIYVTK